MKVLVPGYGGRFADRVDRWRMKVAVETLAEAGGGSLIVSGHNGEAERLSQLAPPGVEVIRETTARSTWENVERSLPALDDADRIAIASDHLHARRALGYLRQLRPDLADRVVPAHRRWPRGLWMDAAGALDLLRRARRAPGAHAGANRSVMSPVGLRRWARRSRRRR